MIFKNIRLFALISFVFIAVACGAPQEKNEPPRGEKTHNIETELEEASYSSSEYKNYEKCKFGIFLNGFSCLLKNKCYSETPGPHCFLCTIGSAIDSKKCDTRFPLQAELSSCTKEACNGDQTCVIAGNTQCADKYNNDKNDLVSCQVCYARCLRNQSDKSCEDDCKKEFSSSSIYELCTMVKSNFE